MGRIHQVASQLGFPTETKVQTVPPVVPEDPDQTSPESSDGNFRERTDTQVTDSHLYCFVTMSVLLPGGRELATSKRRSSPALFWKVLVNFPEFVA